MSLRSPLGRVLGHGLGQGGRASLVGAAAHLASRSCRWRSGSLVSLLSLPSFDHVTVIAWMAQSWTALLLMLFVLVGDLAFAARRARGRRGLRAWCGAEDADLVAVTFVHVLLAAAGVFAVLQVAFGGAA